MRDFPSISEYPWKTTVANDLLKRAQEAEAENVELRELCTPDIGICAYCGKGDINLKADGPAEGMRKHILSCPKHPLGGLLVALKPFLNNTYRTDDWQPLYDAAKAAQENPDV